MNKIELATILEKHRKWVYNEPDGERADLYCADLSSANLSGANLRSADLYCADLSGADLSGANLRSADLRSADLYCANLSGADLSGANLRSANLRSANLSGADLYCANLSGAEGIISTVNYMEAHFERTERGYIAYKTFGGSYNPNKDWKIEKGSVISENVNFTRTNECGCGINVAPLEWVKRNYRGTIWKVLIKWEWLCGVCVPYCTDGKIRCERVQLLEVIE